MADEIPLGVGKARQRAERGSLLGAFLYSVFSRRFARPVYYVGGLHSYSYFFI